LPRPHELNDGAFRPGTRADDQFNVKLDLQARPGDRLVAAVLLAALRALEQLLSEDVGEIDARSTTRGGRPRASLVERMLLYARRSIIASDVQIEDLVDLNEIRVTRASRFFQGRELPSGVRLTALVLGAPGSAAGAGVALLYGEAGGSWAPVGSVLGEQAGDGVGSALLVGDVDGDGQVDLVLGARGADGAGSGAGAMAVGLGPLSGDLELGALDAVWTGEGAGDYAGGALALGQLSGDGDPDLLVGAGRAGGASGGVGYVITAPATAGSYGLGAAGARLFGPDGALLGTALAVGDLDGDGVADAIMGGFGWSEFAGTVRVALGPLLDDIDLGADADAGLDGSFGFDLAGQSVAAADVDGDGRADLVVGVPGDDSHAPEAGEVLVFPLPAGPLSAELAGTRLLGVMDYDRTGWSVASPGDLDGDGRAELLLGAPGANSEAGLVWLVYGGEGGSRELSLERDGAWSGPVEVGGLGNAVGGAGDVDGDGAPDLLLGAPGAATTWLWPAAG